jgi:hypothetical protein
VFFLCFVDPDRQRDAEIATNMISPQYPFYRKVQSPLRHDGILEQVFQYVGARQYYFIAGVCKSWQQVYCKLQPEGSNSKSTGHSAVHESAARLQLAWAYGYKAKLSELPPATQLLIGRFASLGALRLYGDGQQGADFLGGDSSWSDEFLRGAAQSGCVAKLSWLHSQRNLKLKGHLCLPTGISADAAAGGSVHMLSWLLQRCTSFTAATCAAAAKAGHFEALKWLFERGCSWSASSIATDAAVSGSIKVVVWLKQQGAVYSEATVAAATKHGHTALYEYLQLTLRKELNSG